MLTKRTSIAPGRVERALRGLGMSRTEAKWVLAHGLFDRPHDVPISAVERCLVYGLGLSPSQARELMARGFAALRRWDAERDDHPAHTPN